ncbi:TnsA endonuclease N-terminal domain-containing protein [Ectothiorhodospira sp. BSL-9]|uniref:TnsA endonuclease N-terminal domain-containing protein n=1 Tax=Ectothiorhodospira sp. BSL-9 TaxID=1442136 RepID=UPI0009EDE0F1|nr:TnsA endonuclease N-terminal domain-containing protein [Ectothiorhodospira sp. BSL-9]
MEQEINGLTSMRPVRSIGTSRRSVTGRVAFGGKSIPFESSLERDFLVLLDFDLAVEDVLEQPCRITFTDANGRERHYTPDFLVEYGDGERVIFEVKYRANLKDEWTSLKPRFRAAIRYAKQNGMRFSIATEVEIRGGAYLANARFLRPYRDYKWTPAIDEHLIKTLVTLGETTPESLLAAAYWTLENRIKAVSSLWRLVATRRIHADLYEPLTMATPIWTTLEDGL